MIYYTGDLHGDIKRICNWMKGLNKCMRGEHYLIQLGDAGLNYYLDERDSEKKSALQDEINQLKEKGVEVQILFVRGNHECRPDKVKGYAQKNFHGGKAYIQEEYPNLIFLKDGEIIQLEEKNFLVLGGGYSKDFISRILRGEGYWFDEQLDEAEFIQILNKKNISKYEYIYIEPYAANFSSARKKGSIQSGKQNRILASDDSRKAFFADNEVVIWALSF